MEVYIDDMLVKSLRAKDHLDHLRECFKTLNEYGIKLNPAKCTFGVTWGNSWVTLPPSEASKRTQSK